MAKPAFKVSQLIAFVKQVVGMPYWYGTCGYQCTESRLLGKAKQYPAHYADSRMPRYRDDIAKKKVCFDCIGLMKGFFWTNGGEELLKYIRGEVNDFTNKYGSNNMPDKSANGMLAYCKSKGCKHGKIADLPDVPGILLFSDGHVGLYIGDGKAIEARGFSYGVVETEVKKRKWTDWSYMPDELIEYDLGAVVDKPDCAPAEPDKSDAKIYVLGSRFLRKGSKGSDVAKMQGLLNSVGYNCGNVDGDFGSATERGLKGFQAEYKLEVDGVYGPESHKKLIEAAEKKTFSVKVIGNRVNVRSNPDTVSGKVMRVVNGGAVLTAVGRDKETGWYILDDGNYISYKFIKEI